MADGSKIEWTDATWNPLRGCSRVSDGCRHCYAEGVAARFSGPGMPYEGLVHPTTKGWNGNVRLVPEALEQPLRWKRPRRIFVNSMSDLFHGAVPDSYIAAVFGIMAACPQHTFQVLTKRPERAALWFNTMMKREPRATMHECIKGAMGYHNPRRPAINAGPWPLPNVWLGVSVENQQAAHDRIAYLARCPAAIRWVSAEPLLGPVNLRLVKAFDAPVYFDALEKQWQSGERAVHWVVAGGESGAHARPMHPDWSRSLRDQCHAACVPFFFKQWGEWAPRETWANVGRMLAIKPDGSPVPDDVVPQDVGGQRFELVGKKHTGRLLDGREHNDYPAVRRIAEGV